MFLFRNTLKCLNLQRSMAFYAVASGRQVGIYDSWLDCEQQVKGFKGAKYKKFQTREEAESFIKPKQFSIQKLPKALENDKSKKQQELPTEGKEFWPNDSEQEGIADEDLLASLTEKETAQAAELRKVRKRKAGINCSTDIPSKVPRHVSKEWEAVETKEIGGYEFDVDEEGYVIVYTDGSCINNGGKNASAGFGVYFGDDHPLNAGKPVSGRVTNNVGEIQGAIYAIKTAKAHDIMKLCLNTDSQFLINAITRWVPTWKRKNWKLKDGSSVKNEIDFKKLDALLNEDDDFLVKWNYVKAHKGIKGNEMADKLANQGSDIYRRIHS